MDLSDAELIQRILKRDAEAFALLFDRYIGQITDHLARMLRDAGAADDVAQEVFLRVWHRADQWAGIGAFRAWLYRIATNLALNHLRGKKRKREQPLEMPSMFDEDEDENLVPGWMIDHASLSPDMHVERSEQRRMLGKMIADLPENKREVFEMVYDDELGLKEVASRLGIPEGTVKSRLFQLAKGWQMNGGGGRVNLNRLYNSGGYSMAIDMKAPWHKISWDGFLRGKLPDFLADCMAVEGYRVETVDTYACRLHLSVKGPTGFSDVVYEGIPLCDELGRFRIDGHSRVVVPKPTEVDLQKADILCVGEQVLVFLVSQVGDVPEGIKGSDAIQACLPLSEWIHGFFTMDPTSQYVQMTNDVDMYTHLRRITLFTLLGEAIDGEYVVHPSQEGRVCLFSTPEGPNISRIFEVALGATIRRASWWL